MSAWFSLRSLDKDAFKLPEAGHNPPDTTAASLGASLRVHGEASCGPAPAPGGSVPGGPQLPPEEVGGSLVQPLGVHHAQVAHVALVGEEQLRVYDAGRLAVEEDGRGVDGHGLVGVRGGIGPIGLQLGGAHEEAVRQAAADALCVPSRRQDRHGHLVREEARHGEDPRREYCAATRGGWSHVPPAQSRVQGPRWRLTPGRLPATPEISAAGGAPRLLSTENEGTHAAKRWCGRRAVQVQEGFENGIMQNTARYYEKKSL